MFCLTQKIFIDYKFCSLFVKHFIFLFRLVQSHAQGGPGSANRHGNPDSGIHIFVLQEFLDYL